MATSITRAQVRENAADDLGLLLSVTVTATDSDDLTATIPDLYTKMPDPDHLRDAFITVDGSSYARITKYHLEAAPNFVELSKLPTGISTGTPTAKIYFLLSPEDWNTQINNALEKLGRMVRVNITLDPASTDYPLDDTQLDSDMDECTWIQSRGQIFDIQTKTANDQLIQIEGWSGVSYLEDDNQLTVHLSYIPYTATTLVLRVRKPYVWRDHLLSADVDTTTCPFELAVEAVKEKGMELIFNRYGSPTMRQRFAAMLQVTRDRLAGAKLRYEPPMRPSNYQVEETFLVDIPWELQGSAWGGTFNTW